MLEMERKVKKLLLGSVVCFASSVCFAKGYYAGAAYSMLDTDLKAYGFKFSTEPTALNFKLGNEFSKNFAAEALLGLGLSEDKVNSEFDFELTLLGVAAVWILTLNETFKVYGKVGLAQIKYDDSDGDKSDASGLLYGVGCSINFNPKFGASLEYIQYPDGEYDDFDVDVETSAINLGAFIKF